MEQVIVSQGGLHGAAAWRRPMRPGVSAGEGTALLAAPSGRGSWTDRRDHAIIGPVLQRLRLPVNDLSRRATIEPIVRIVVITAIQSPAGPVGRGGSRAGKARSILNTKNPAR